jgi:hypothetical protein
MPLGDGVCRRECTRLARVGYRCGVRVCVVLSTHVFAFGCGILVIKLSSSIKIWYAILAYSIKKELFIFLQFSWIFRCMITNRTVSVCLYFIIAQPCMSTQHDLVVQRSYDG